MLKKKIKNLLLFVFIKINKIFSYKPTKHSVLILLPSDGGSLGDIAMFEGWISILPKKGLKKVGILYSESASVWKDILVSSSVDFEIHSINGFNPLSFVRTAKKYEEFQIMGADMMDGYYSEYSSYQRLELLKYANHLGLRARILGCSFNEKPPKLIKDTFRQLSANIVVYARDSDSFERLKNLPVKNIRLSADLAFLMKPKKAHKLFTHMDVIERARKENAFVLGLNVNSFQEKLINVKVNLPLDEVYVNLIEKLMSEFKNLQIIMLPHDNRNDAGQNSDWTLSQMVLEKLPEEVANSAILPPEDIGPDEIKYLAGLTDFIITGRMHLAIAALGQKVPIISFTYQDKFTGLYKHFDLKGTMIDLSEVNDFEEIYDFVLKNIRDRANLKNKISKNIKKIVELAESNVLVQ